MEYKFGKVSEKRLNTCHKDIQRLMKKAIKTSPLDFSIICGHRNKKEQNEAFEMGYSKVKWPNGNHNKFPSNAVDIAPYPRLFEASIDDWLLLSNHVKKVAEKEGIDVRWGGDWNDNGDYRDEKFLDLPHWELRRR